MVSYELYIDLCISHVPIKLDNKLKVYKAVELPTLLYERHAKRLNLFHLCFEKADKINSRHRGLEESRDTKHAYRLKASTAKMDWSCYKNA